MFVVVLWKDNKINLAANNDYANLTYCKRFLFLLLSLMTLIKALIKLILL